MAHITRSIRNLFVAALTVIGLALASARAGVEILWQTPINFTNDGAYGIVHYGMDRGRPYIQIYVHDTKPDHRCGEVWADFRTVANPDHQHIDPARAIVCGYGKKAWSDRYYAPRSNGRWYVNGVRWVDACWRNRSARDCRYESADNNNAINEGRYRNLRVHLVR